LFEQIGAGIPEIPHRSEEELGNTLGLHDQGRQDGMERRKRRKVRAVETKTRKRSFFHNSLKDEMRKKKPKTMERQNRERRAAVGRGRDEGVPEGKSSAEKVIWDLD
jgi:hypothetical protein